MKSWIAPSPEKIHIYWPRKLNHECLAGKMNLLLKDGTQPEWLTQTQTVLIMTDPQKGMIPSSYCLVNCVCTTWWLIGSDVRVAKH